MIAVLVAILSGVLYGLSFPPFNFHFLAWICLVPLFCLIRNNTSGMRGVVFRLGLLSGLIANLIIFFWIWKTFAAAKVNFPTTLAAWVLLALILGLYFGFFCFIYSCLPRTWYTPWIGASLWVGLDQLRAVAFSGFPWALFAHTQTTHLSFLQMASFAGAGGITFVLILFNSSLSLIKESWKNWAVVCLLVLCLIVWGGHRLTAVNQSDASKHCLKVAILQGNIDQYKKWNEGYESDIQNTYAKLVAQASVFKPDLIVWPESAIPGWYPNEKKYVDWVRQIVSQSKTYHLIGAVTSRSKKDYNAAFLINPAGAIVGEYDKQHRVPFGEYVPFEKLLAWIPYLGELGTFSAGEKPALFRVGETHISPNICYEAIFPRLVRNSVKQGADVIINITNDGWFLDTGAPEQHYVANIFRAVETGKPLIRAANTGISAVIDPFGREMVRSQLLTSGVFTATVCYTPAHVARTQKPNRNPLQKS